MSDKRIRGKNPTVKQSKIMESHGYDSDDYLIKKAPSTGKWELIHRETGDVVEVII